GTTGPPKGVQTRHENELSAGRSFDQIIQCPDGARAVSYLPMAHIAERSCTHYLPIMFGFTVTCCPDARQVISYLPEVKPSWFFAVPRIFEKLKAAMEAGMEAEQDEERKKFAKHALEVGLKKVRLEQPGEEGPDDLREPFEKFDEDGFLLTGDIGEFDEDGFLKIVDRKKELIINAAGKNMSPANIEAKLKTASPLIGQAIAIGDARPYNVALVTLDPDSVPGF